MNTKLSDFIYSIAEFNDCTFCKKFGFAKSCPLKNAYKDSDEYPSEKLIEQNQQRCKLFVIDSLKYCISSI